MKKKTKQVVLIALSALAGLATSCNNGNCPGNSNAIPLAEFYQDGSSVIINNLTVYGIGAPGDSLILDEASASSVYMPLHISTGNCCYVLDYNTEGLEADTIKLEYEAIPYFESHECGAMFNFRITGIEYTLNAIDSIAITRTLINNDDVASIKIYMQ